MMTDEVTQISLGRFKVGIAGLKEAIEEVRTMRGRPEGEIAEALLTRLRPRNYIPPAAEVECRQAFLREFKKALGEKVDYDTDRQAAAPYIGQFHLIQLPALIFLDGQHHMLWMAMGKVADEDITGKLIQIRRLKINQSSEVGTL